MKKDNLSVCLLNDSFPPVIDGVANAVLNYASMIQDQLGSCLLYTSYPQPYRGIRPVWCGL